MNLIEQMLKELQEALPEASFTLDPCENPRGPSFLDGKLDDHHVAIIWNPGFRFEINAQKEPEFLVPPDELFSEQDLQAAINRVMTILKERIFTS